MRLFCNNYGNLINRAFCLCFPTTQPMMCIALAYMDVWRFLSMGFQSGWSARGCEECIMFLIHNFLIGPFMIIDTDHVTKLTQRTGN